MLVSLRAFCIFLVSTGLGFGQVIENGEIPTLFQKLDPATQADPDLRFVWKAQPDVRYNLYQSTNLKDWSRVGGEPIAASGSIGLHEVNTRATPSGFFKIEPVDEQAPEIVRRYPDNEDFGIARFADLEIDLADMTGIDAASVSLSVGSQGPFTLASTANLTLTDGKLVYDTVDVAHGTHGETVDVQLDIADTLGNSTRYRWSFRLALESVTADNVFVFGSAQAQRSGQGLSQRQRAVSLSTVGNVRVPASSSQWEIESVQVGSIVIDYSAGGTVPVFSVGQLLANAAPSNRSEIFYREVTAWQDNTSTKKLTLTTVDVALTRFIQQGSLAMSSESLLFNQDAGGGLTPAVSRSYTQSLGVWGGDFSHESYSAGNWTLSFDALHAKVKPSLHLAFDVSDWELKKLSFRSALDYDYAAIPRLTHQSAGGGAFDVEIYEKSKTFWLGSIGFVPIWMDVNFRVNLFGEVTATNFATFWGGYRRSGHVSNALLYNGADAPKIRFDPRFTPLKEEEFNYVIHGDASAKIGVRPQFDFALFSLAGAFVNVDPRFEFEGEARQINGELDAASWAMCGCADFNAGLRLEFDDVSLQWTPLKSPLFKYKWCDGYPRGDVPDIIFDLKPENFGDGEDYAVWLEEEDPDNPEPRSITVSPCDPEDEHEGDCEPKSIRLQASACAPSLVTYQWYFNANKIPGANQEVFKIDKLRSSDLGVYHVEVTMKDGKASEASEFIELERCGGGFDDPCTGQTGDDGS